MLVPENEESVLLGSAILAACAAQAFPNIQVRQFQIHLNEIYV